MKSETDHLNDIFTLLVTLGGACEDMRRTFIHNHLSGCEEWRFMGDLGYGGKYRSRTNSVDCYREDENPARLLIIEKLNRALADL